MFSIMATNNDGAFDNPLSLVCKLCDKPYQHKDGPLLLPCLHSFCKPCLTEYVKKAPAADNKIPYSGFYSRSKKYT